MHIKQILITLSILLITTITFADTTNAYPDLLNFPDGTRITIDAGQEVTVYQNQQTLSQSWFKDNGYDYWQTVKFVQQLQKAVNNKNIKTIADMIRYPLTINGQLKKVIKNKAGFLQNYANIFTAKVQNTIAKLNPYVLFCNSEGVSFSNGLMWITNTYQNPNDLKISVINLSQQYFSKAD